MQITEEHKRNIVEVLLDAETPDVGLAAAATLLCIYELAEDNNDDAERIRPALVSERRFVKTLKQRWPILLARVRVIAIRSLEAEDAMEPGSLAENIITIRTARRAKAKAAGA